MVCAYVTVLMACGGATCTQRRSAIPEFNPPPLFTQGTPTLADLVEKTNRSLAIQSLSSNSLSIDSPDLAYKLSGNFNWQRPHNLRLETKLFTSALGTPLAAGSNSEMFWLVAQRPTPTIYYASHNEFEGQQGPRHVLPVSPLWLREAFGIVELDPTGRHEQPLIRPDGKLQVVSYVASSRGDYKRVLVMAPITGTIENTLLYDQNGKLIASAQLSDHQYYSAIDWSLPHKIQVQLQPDVGEPLIFKMEVGYYSINESKTRSEQFSFPDTTGLSAVDLVRTNAQLQRQTVVPNSGWGENTPSPMPSNPLPPGAQPTSQGVSTTATPPVYRAANAESLDAQWQKYLAR